MVYVFPITTPANTAASAKQKTILPLTAGRIVRAMLEFPSGHVGLTHIHINRGLNQLWPTNPDKNFSASNETINFEEALLFLAPPFQLEAYTWNEDDTYEHMITVRIVIEKVTVERTIVEEVKSLLGL